MERIWLNNWPADLPKELEYRLGERPLHEYLRQNAADNPDKVAYIYYGRRITWSQLNRYTDSVAAFLASIGVQKGDRVVLFMQNCPQYIIAHYGTQKTGAVVAPANPCARRWSWSTR